MISKIRERVTEFRDSDRGVSPVIGVALLIAVTVVLAAVIGFVVLGADTGPGTDEPSARLDISGETSGNGTLTIDHEGGDPISTSNLEIKLGNNAPTEANNTSLSGTLQTGETVSVDGGNVTGGNFTSGDTVTLLYDPPETDGKTQLAEFTFP